MISSKIFRSRWSALFWSAGIVWTAYDIATSAPHRDPAANAQAPAGDTGQTDATGEAVTKADLETLAGVMNGQ